MRSIKEKRFTCVHIVTERPYGRPCEGPYRGLDHEACLGRARGLLRPHERPGERPKT